MQENTPDGYALIKILDTDAKTVRDFAEIAVLRGYPKDWAVDAFNARTISNTREFQQQVDQRNQAWHKRWEEMNALQ
jgi:hypothetical protein